MHIQWWRGSDRNERIAIKLNRIKTGIDFPLPTVLGSSIYFVTVVSFLRLEYTYLHSLPTLVHTTTDHYFI